MFMSMNQESMRPISLPNSVIIVSQMHPPPPKNTLSKGSGGGGGREILLRSFEKNESNIKLNFVLHSKQFHYSGKQTFLSLTMGF